MKISLKISLIAATIVLLTFTIFSVVQYYLTERSLYKQAETTIQETANVLDGQISAWLNNKTSSINMMADMLTNSGSDTATDIIRSTEAKSLFQLVYFAPHSDKNGTVVFSDPSLQLDIDARQRPWYKLALNHPRATLTEAYLDKATGFPVISAVSQVNHKAQGFLGVLGGDISTENISNTLNSVNFNNAGYVFLLDRNGRVIIHPDMKLFGKNATELFNGADTASTGNIQSVTVAADKDYLVKFKRLQGTTNNWILGVAIDKSVALQELKTLAINAIIGTIISALLCTLLIYLFMNRSIIKPIKTLTDTADKISKGKIFDAVESEYVSRKDEIGELAEGFERMRKSLSIAFTKIKKLKKEQ